MLPLKALLIADGRPGHFHLSEGILASVARKRRLEIERLEVRRPRGLTPGMVCRLSRLLPPHRLLKRFYGIDPEQIAGTGLIVSSGGDTLAPNIAAALVSAAPNIFYGSLRRYRPQDFSLVLTSYERDASAPNSAMTLKPSAADPDQIGSRPRHSTDLGGLLVGGNSGTFTFRDPDWNELIAFLERDHATTGRRWLVSNSPRTPAAVSDRLSALARDPNGAIAEFVDIRSRGTGTLAPIFGQVSTVLCTGDSSSMLSEAVWMRRPVIAVFPQTWTLPDLEQTYRRYLERNAWAASLPIAGLTTERFEQMRARLTPLSRNPLDDLAALIIARIAL